MSVPAWLWTATIAGLLLVVAADLWAGNRRDHPVTTAEALRWLGLYAGLAVLFGLGIWLFAGPTWAGEFFGGYLTEYSLSVDNLLVFVIIMTSFRVPTAHRHRVLLVGIVLALVLRGVFIGVGTVAVTALSWLFYLFAAFLLYTAAKMARPGGGDAEWTEPRVVGLVRRFVPMTPGFRDGQILARHEGRLRFTPMLVVTVSIGVTDLLFALDSIPAIFGLTQQAYLILTANAFALMALRQLYVLLDRLLRKLVYLSHGLAVVLGFIAVKLVLHALRTNDLPLINAGRPVPVPDIGIAVSLLVIAGVLSATALASLVAVHRNPALDATGVDNEAPAPVPTDPHR